MTKQKNKKQPTQQQNPGNINNPFQKMYTITQTTKLPSQPETNNDTKQLELTNIYKTTNKRQNMRSSGQFQTGS